MLIQEEDIMKNYNNVSALFNILIMKMNVYVILYFEKIKNLKI